MKHNFEERKQKRIDSARSRADKNEKEAAGLHISAQQMTSVIPLGQPILVGHHSEKSDRRYRERIHNTFGKSYELQKKAAYLRNKADSIENNSAIFSDDPKAIEKLEAKLTTLQELQEFMKAANRKIRQQDKAGFLKMPYATEERWDQLNTPDFMNRIGFADYSLKNNNANIRKIKQRIENLKRAEASAPKNLMVNGVHILENKEVNRLQMIFKGKPEEHIRKKLKSDGFRWSPSQGAWQSYISTYAMSKALAIAESLPPVQ